MAMPLICPRGHQWTPDEQSNPTAPRCPICGLAAVSTAAAFPRTLEMQPEPRELDPPSPSDTSSNRATIPVAMPDRGDDAAPLLTQHIPGYDILGELGRGGMGIVYKARQLKLNRVVALKMILAGAQADSRVLERFRAEAEAVARLQHPYIVQIHEISDYNGCPFFSLEYVDGGTLADKLNGAPQPPRLAAHLLRLLALAMHSAHQKGIIHRDLKPGNILLAVPTEHVSGADSLSAETAAALRLFGIPKITDFGLAKQLDIQSQTHSGAIVGTPSYMAPEQAEGHSHAIGPATDVYGLGAILYEMLTGRPPFESDSTLTTIRQLIGQDPLTPSQLQVKVPRDLETICLKCLEKDPARRYHSAEDLAEDLQRFLSNQPIEARPLGRWGRGVKWMRRHPTRTAVGIVISLAVLALLSMGLVYHLNMQSAFEQSKKYAQESKENLIRLHVAQGTSAMNAGDGFTALLWFTEALRLDAGPPEHEQPHRQRIAALKQGLPRPEQLWVHDGPVNEARFSPDPDGIRVLTGGEGGKIRLWNSETGEESVPPLILGGAVTFAVFSKNGQRIAAGGTTRTARVWDARDGQPLTPPLPLRGPLRWLDFSPDGQLLATVGGGEARLWDVSTGRPLDEVMHIHGGINVALFSPDGRWLASGGDDGALRLWDMAARKSVPAVAAHDRAILCLAFSPDSTRLASGSADHTAQVWDVASGAAVGRHLRHADSVLHVVFSPYGRRLLTSSEDGTAQIWSVADSERLVDALRHKSMVRWAAFSPDGCRVATAGDDNSARLWSANTGAPLTPPLRGNGSVNRVAFSPDGRRLAVASDDGTARVWDIACRHQAHVVDEAGVFRRRADRDLRAGGLDAAPRGADATPLAASTSPDGRFRIKTINDNTAQVYRVSDGAAVTPPLAHRGEITHAAFSPDGRWVVTTSLDETARVWDAATGAPVGWPLRHASGIEYADFDAEGRRLVTGSDDNSARIWDIASGALLVPPLKHDGTVVRAIFDHAGRRVATGSLDQTARVWDAATGQALTPPLVHPWSVRGLRFSDEGQHLLTTSARGTVWSWSLPCTACESEDLIRLAQLLCGSRVDEHRGIMPLAPGELKDLWTTLRQTRSDLFRFSADDVTAWHRQIGEACLRGQHWRAAVFHLDRLVEQEPDNWLWCADRGCAQAELGHWKQAHEDFAEVVRRAPEEPEAWCLYGLLSLHQGDVTDYRRACAALQKQQEKNANPRLAYLLAWIGVLSPDSGIKSEQLVSLAKPAVEREPRDPDYLGTLGAALYRAGELQEAALRLNEALRLRGRHLHTREWLWLALLRQRMGLSSEARKWLEKATAAVASADAAALPWEQRLQLELLQREAKQLSKDSSTPSRKKSEARQ